MAFGNSITVTAFLSITAPKNWAIGWAGYKSTRVIPHGVKYAINLFDKDKNRIIDFDNAHGYKEYRRIVWVPIPKKDRVLP